MRSEVFIDQLWRYTHQVPMEQHPWFQGILRHRSKAHRLLFKLVDAPSSLLVEPSAPALFDSNLWRVLLH